MSGLEIPLVVGGSVAMIVSCINKYKEIAVNGYNISSFCAAFWNRQKQLKNITKLLFHSFYNRISSGGKYLIQQKKDEKPLDFFKMIKELFVDKKNKDVIEVYKRLEKLQEFLRHVDFDDNYFKQNMKDLILNPKKMEEYVLRKALAMEIHNTILVKLFNAYPKDELVMDLKNEIILTFVDIRLDLEDVKKIAKDFEKKINDDYKKYQPKYDKEFEEEKKKLSQICEEIKTDKDYKRRAKAAITDLKELILDQENDVLDTEEITKQLSSSIKLVEDKQKDNELNKSDVQKLLDNLKSK